jgi:hypothetical protein
LLPLAEGRAGLEFPPFTGPASFLPYTLPASLCDTALSAPKPSRRKCFPFPVSEIAPSNFIYRERQPAAASFVTDCLHNKNKAVRCQLSFSHSFQWVMGIA